MIPVFKPAVFGSLLYLDTYILISEVSKDVFVVARVSNKSSLEECNVEDGRVEIDELEQEDLERQVVVELGLGSMHLWNWVFEILF